MPRTSHAAPVCEPANRGVPQPDHREHDQPGQHGHRKQVLQEAQHERMPDPRDRERPAEQVAVGLDDREDQNDEAPEGEQVRGARHRPLQQLPLPEHLSDLDLHIPAGMLACRLQPLRRRLASQPQTAQPPQPAAGDRGGRHRHHQAKDDSQGHQGPPPAASAASVRCWLPGVIAQHAAIPA
jgi:hypothetical protein